MNIKNSGGFTPLASAAIEGHTEIVKLLLEKHAKVDLVNNHGNTALILAAYKGYTEIVKLLLKANAGVDLKNSCYATASDLVHNLRHERSISRPV